MTHVELIDEGYCSSKRASLSYWDGMDFNSYDLGGPLTDLEQPYFGDQPITIDPAQLAAVERAYGCAPELYGQTAVWKAATPVSGPYSLTSSAASLTSGHEVVPQPVAYNQPWCGIQNSLPPVTAALPPLQRSSTAPLPLFAQEFAQPAAVHGWAPHAAAGRQHSLNSQAGPSGMQPGPSGMHFGPVHVEEHASRPHVVNSPVSVSNASEPISSPGSVASGALQQPLSPSDERRLRNNEASRRSRQNQKTKNEELQIKLYQLELENLSLKKNIDEVTKMVKYMKEKLVEYMQSKS